MSRIMKAFIAMHAFTEWLEKAVADDVIDQNEMIDCVRVLLEIFDVKAEIKLN